ncbi:MAG: GGDEF domain-containing protein [Desulfuromonas sp.]|nr:MAG: GGDEF domain-containing protein [Desulfuromonas sp.]
MISKRKLIVTLSLLLVCGFLLTSLASYYASLNSLRVRIDDNELPLTSDTIYSEIQRDLLRPLFISSLMANDTFLRDWVTEGEQDSDKVVRYLSEIKRHYGTFTSFFVSEHSRRYYHANGILKTVAIDEPRDVWYFRVRDMDKDYEINVDPDLANHDSMTIFINYRVKDYQNRFIGATGVGLTVSAVKTLIESYQQRYDRTIFFVDPHGTVTLAGSQFPAQIHALSDIEGLAPHAKSLLTEEQTTLVYQRNGETLHLNTRFIPEFNWYLMVEQSETAVTQQIRLTLLINLALCATITIIVLFLTQLTISRYQRRLEEMALTDKLTNIANRQAIDLHLEQTFKEQQRDGIAFSLILFDLDNFKQINDTHGHLAGDLTLVEVARATQKLLRSCDVFGRWGGEEFLIILKQCSLEDAMKRAESIRLAIQSLPIEHDQQTIYTTASFGVVDHLADDNRDSLLKRVDQALYIAKHNGKNRSEKLAAL